MGKRVGGGRPRDGGFAGGRNLNYFDTAASAKKCYHSHPELTLNGGRFVGGSCLYPAVTDCDIYVGLDAGMRVSGRQLPWTDGVEFLLPITDQRAPPDAAQFRELVEYLWAALGDGKSVHVGCVGGHGRTGLVVAALASLSGVKTPLAWTREQYCEKAVESKDQIDFLAAEWGGEPDAMPRHRTGWSGGWGKPSKGRPRSAVDPDPDTDRDTSALPEPSLFGPDPEDEGVEKSANGEATVWGSTLIGTIKK